MSEAESELTAKEVEHIAALARLRLHPGQVELFRGQLGSILRYVRQLQELDVDGVEPLSHPTDITNRLAADVPGPCLPLAAMLRNAPSSEDRFLSVPKVIIEESGS